MKLAYYPGCSGHGTGRELDESTRDLCDRLGIELQELDDWNCCGASSAHSIDEGLGVALAARNLAIADKTGLDVMTPCSACFARLAGARKHVLEHGAPEGVEDVTGQSKVFHVLDLFGNEEFVEHFHGKVQKPLAGLTLACYYGCLTNRPPEVTGKDNPENPREMETLLEAAGAETVDWPLKTVCCGGSLTLSRDEIVGQLCGNLFDMARQAGAQALVTGCPMCFMNLDRQWGAANEQGIEALPVLYFTELMLYAIDPSRGRSLFKHHLSDPTQLFSERGLP